MKVEGGGVATTSGAATSVLHKIKVKEEAKECPSQQQSSAPTSPLPPSRLAIGAIATITISSGCGDLAAAAAAAAAANVAANSGKRSSPAVEPETDDALLPVDLDLKSSRAKGFSRDKAADANGTESRGSSSPSPSSSPSSQSYQQPSKSQSQQPPRATSSSSARSPDSDEGPSLQALKTEAEDAAAAAAPGRQQDETKLELGGGARCIAGVFAAHGKLKRLLGTLVQFAMDISPDTGDTVRTLVLGLLSGSMSAEEFHSALQEATNFPLRGFVLPYLKHTLPSLQRDLSAAARADNQTCGQYLRANESSVLEAVGLAPGVGPESVELFAEQLIPPPPPPPGHHYAAMRPGGPAITTTAGGGSTGMHSTPQAAAAAPAHLGYGSHAGKRRASELYYENGAAFEDGPPYAKRPPHPWSAQQHHPAHHPHGHGHHGAHLGHGAAQHHGPDLPYCWYAQPPSSSHLGPAAAAHGSLLPSLVQIGYGAQQQAQAAHLPHQPASLAHGSASGGAPTQNGSASLDDEWKNIHVMLNCILGMVEKTKRALAILQRRGCSSPAAATVAGAGQSLQVPVTAVNGGQPASIGNGVQQQLENAAGAADRDGTFKRLSGEIVAQTIRATEDRVAEVKRRAEEAVQEVKRAAVAEVQRAVAVAVAESRASERLRSQRYLDSLPLPGQRAHVTPQHTGRPSPFLRLAETTARTASTPSGPTTASSTSTVSGDEEKESHLGGTMGSNCWNCGRAALETCGGCGVARYCGSFCQHRDWEAGGHHATCSSTAGASTERARSSATPSPPRTASAEPEALAKGTSQVVAAASSSAVRAGK